MQKLPPELQDSEALRRFLCEQLGPKSVKDIRTMGAEGACAYVRLTSFRAVCQSRMIAAFEMKFVPDENDILEENMSIVERKYAKASTEGLILVSLLFWSVPVSLLQALVHRDNLQSFFELPTLIPSLMFIVDYLPALITLLLLSIIPEVMYFLALRVEQLQCLSMVERSAANRYYYFFLATVYFNVVSGSVFGILGKVTDDPKAFRLLFSWLGRVGRWGVVVEGRWGYVENFAPIV